MTAADKTKLEAIPDPGDIVVDGDIGDGALTFRGRRYRNHWNVYRQPVWSD